MAPLDSLPPYSRLDDVPPCYDPDQALAEFNGLSSDQQAQLSKSLSQAASGDDAVSQLKKSATDAATAAAAIDDLFDDLTSKLISLKITDQDFVNRFEKIHKNYRKILSHSRDQATDISQYAESFDEIVINFCADKTLDVERRKKKIQEFINDGDDIKKESEKLQESFDGLKDDLKTFLSDFSEWAEPREEADEEKIKELTKQISDLNDQLNSIDTAISSISSALAVTLPVTGALALIFPPAAPWIMIAGCTLAGLELGSVVGLLIAKNLIMKDKKSKEDAIKDLDGEIGEIKATRTQLKDVGDSYYKKFKTNINALSKTWVHVQSDAKEIHKWLQDGADDADQPEYMKQSLEHAVTIYTSMAKYLKEYADGTALTVQEFKATK